jgi:hypothetical protein
MQMLQTQPSPPILTDNQAKQQHPNLKSHSSHKRRFAIGARPTQEGQLSYFKITCPRHSCKKELVLICPDCQGPLAIADHSEMLVCSDCHQTVSEVFCRCGFCLKSSYISQKIAKMLHLMALTDVKGYKLLFAIFFITIFGIFYWRG